MHLGPSSSGLWRCSHALGNPGHLISAVVESNQYRAPGWRAVDVSGACFNKLAAARPDSDIETAELPNNTSSPSPLFQGCSLKPQSSS